MTLPRGEGEFSALLPLLGHSAVEVDHAPALDPALGTRLRHVFAATDVAGFVADAKRVAKGIRLAVRHGDVCLGTENPLTAGFTPPHADHVASGLATALKSIDTALEQCIDDAGKAACAVVGMQILLTIHPFRDGNGRTARMFFAAKVLRHVGPAPSALLGMLLMQRAGAHQYHQACWALRTGDPEPLVRLFVDSERMACERVLGTATTQSPASLLEHCWTELRRQR